MPSIKISEVDLTSGGTVETAEDVVFVPGFVNKDLLTDENIVDAYVPTLCNTVAEFESYFGAIPASFAEAQTYSSLDGLFDDNAKPSSVNMFLANEMDPGYVYAKELLSLGLPVYYCRVNESDKDITAKHMYEFLTETTDDNIWTILQDIGEYQEVKYLTSGGYPTFEYFRLMPSTPVVYKVGAAFDWDTFLSAAKIDTSTQKDDITYLWEAKDVEGLITWTMYIDGTSEGTKSPELYGFSINPDNPAVDGSTITLIVRASRYSVVANKMLNCAASRGDCVALIDHTNNPTRVLDPTNSASVYYSISNTGSSYRISSNGEFGTMFTPWCGCALVSDLYSTLNSSDITPSSMPASFVYLRSLAKSVVSNSNWLAVAGVARGVADITKLNLNGTLRLSNSIADSYQPRNAISINPITNIKPYGYVIWGNRTLKNNATEGNLTATSFLNTRNMVSDIKKVAFLAARRCMFEQNSDILWINYKARLTPTLDTLVSGGGLSGYKLIKGTTTEKAKLVCTIRLYPLYAVESFDITVELADDEVTVS